MCIYVYIYMYVYIYIYVNICIHMYARVCPSVCLDPSTGSTEFPVQSLYLISCCGTACVHTHLWSWVPAHPWVWPSSRLCSCLIVYVQHLGALRCVWVAKAPLTRIQQTAGESPIDNLQLPNLMSRKTALLMTAGHRSLVVFQFVSECLEQAQGP